MLAWLERILARVFAITVPSNGVIIDPTNQLSEFRGDRFCGARELASVNADDLWVAGQIERLFR